ncbi:hypothetical protein P7H21_23030 [Paenibacillus larvae]|nr:hypothetical protein [Paenibacillus larvae]MDT2306229.1 hypothetical protein [Paenibacillus larvae]
MAHYSEQRGKASQLAAKLALVSSGWVVAEPETEEPYDLIGRDPVNGEWYTFQVKTIRKRYDRGGDLVVYAKRITASHIRSPTLTISLAYWGKKTSRRAYFTL